MFRSLTHRYLRVITSRITLAPMFYIVMFVVRTIPHLEYNSNIITPIRGFTSAIFSPCFVSVYYVTPCLAPRPHLLACVWVCSGVWCLRRARVGTRAWPAHMCGFFVRVLPSVKGAWNQPHKNLLFRFSLSYLDWSSAIQRSIKTIHHV